jgi:hypothetical protein
MGDPSANDYNEAVAQVLANTNGWKLASTEGLQDQMLDSIGYKLRHNSYPQSRAVSIVFHPTAFDWIDGSEQLRKDALAGAIRDLQSLSDIGWTEHQLVDVR